MTIRITVPHRPHWWQLMEAELDSPEVGERLELIAGRWWTRYRGAITVTVTASDAESGAERTHTAHAFDPYSVSGSCPNCGVPLPKKSGSSLSSSSTA